MSNSIARSEISSACGRAQPIGSELRHTHLLEKTLKRVRQLLLHDALLVLGLNLVGVVQILALAEVRGDLAHLRVELDVLLLLLAHQDAVLRVSPSATDSTRDNLQMEVEQNHHLVLARLEESMLDVAEQNVDLVALL